MDENGQPVRMQPKLRPFLNTPKITPIAEIPEPASHPVGYVWNIVLHEKVPYICVSESDLVAIGLQTVKFIGPPRCYPANRAAREEGLKQEKRKAVAERMIREEDLMRKAEELRIAEEQRIAELQYLRQKYVKDEERRVLELAVPLRQYVSHTVLGDLIDGLVETARARPANPVRFLGEYLMDKAVK